jgi:hypothetical protein
LFADRAVELTCQLLLYLLSCIAKLRFEVCIGINLSLLDVFLELLVRLLDLLNHLGGLFEFIGKFFN